MESNLLGSWLDGLASASSNSMTPSITPTHRGDENSTVGPIPETTSAKKTQTIKQLFFDCDNTLVLSEETALQCTAELVNRILAAHGITEQYTIEKLITEYFGLTFKAMLTPLQIRHGFELTPEQIAYWMQKEEDAVIEELRRSPRASKNVESVLQKLRNESTYGLAVVSSSQLPRIVAALESCELLQYFAHHHIFSAKSSMPTSTSKPDPAIYTWAMDKLGVQPQECVAVEDSRSGVYSAVAARIPCIAYVGAYVSKDQREQVSQLLLDAGCKVVMYDWSEFFDCLEAMRSV